MIVKLVKTRGVVTKRLGIPPLERRLQILIDLLKIKHFDGIWCYGSDLSVRRVPDGPLEHLSWTSAQQMLDAAAGLQPKPAKSESFKTLRKAAGSRG